MREQSDLVSLAVPR